MFRLTGKLARTYIVSRRFIPVSSYHQKVLDHYENPRNVGSLDKNDDKVGTGLVGAPACGDVMKLQIKVIQQNWRNSIMHIIFVFIAF